MEDIIEKARKLVYENETDKAIQLLDDYLNENPLSDTGYFLLGNASLSLAAIFWYLNFIPEGECRHKE